MKQQEPPKNIYLLRQGHSQGVNPQPQIHQGHGNKELEHSGQGSPWGETAEPTQGPTQGSTFPYSDLPKPGEPEKIPSNTPPTATALLDPLDSLVFPVSLEASGTSAVGHKEPRDENAKEEGQQVLEKEEPTPKVTQPSKHPLLLPGSIIALWADAADRLMVGDSGDAALLYLHILRKGSSYPSGWQRARSLQAQNILKSMGLYDESACINDPKPGKGTVGEREVLVSEAPPEYTTDDVILRLRDTGGEYATMCDRVAELMGKALTLSDQKILLYLNDHLGFEPSVILMLVSWVKEEAIKKFGPSARVTLNDVRSQGNYWSKSKVRTFQDAELFMQKKLHEQHWEVGLLQILQLKSRDMTESERTYAHQWKNWKFSDEVLAYAYERTVFHIGDFSWNYMNSILKNWHGEGYQTVDEIKMKDNHVGKRPQKPQGQYGNSYGGKQPKKQNGPKMREPVSTNSETTEKKVNKDMERLRRALGDSIPKPPENS